MNWFVESPWPALLGGGATVLILGVAWWQSRQKFLLWATLAAVGVTAVLLVVQSLVVTDRERIEATLEQARAALQANDRAGVLATVAETPQGKKLRDQLNGYYSYIQFDRVKTGTKRDIEINYHASPPLATVEFLGAAYGKSPPINYAGKFQVTMVLIDNEWKIETAESENIAK